MQFLTLDARIEASAVSSAWRRAACNPALWSTWIFCRNMVDPEDADLPPPSPPVPGPEGCFSRVAIKNDHITNEEYAAKRARYFAPEFSVATTVVCCTTRQSGLQFTKKGRELIQSPKKRTRRSSFHNVVRLPRFVLSNLRHARRIMCDSYPSQFFERWLSPRLKLMRGLREVVCEPVFFSRTQLELPLHQLRCIHLGMYFEATKSLAVTLSGATMLRQLSDLTFSALCMLAPSLPSQLRVLSIQDSLLNHGRLVRVFQLVGACLPLIHTLVVATDTAVLPPQQWVSTLAAVPSSVAHLYLSFDSCYVDADDISTFLFADSLFVERLHAVAPKHVTLHIEGGWSCGSLALWQLHSSQVRGFMVPNRRCYLTQIPASLLCCIASFLTTVTVTADTDPDTVKQRDVQWLLNGDVYPYGDGTIFSSNEERVRLPDIAAADMMSSMLYHRRTLDIVCRAFYGGLQPLWTVTKPVQWHHDVYGLEGTFADIQHRLKVARQFSEIADGWPGAGFDLHSSVGRISRLCRALEGTEWVFFVKGQIKVFGICSSGVDETDDLVEPPAIGVVDRLCQNLKNLFRGNEGCPKCGSGFWGHSMHFFDRTTREKWLFDRKVIRHCLPPPGLTYPSGSLGVAEECEWRQRVREWLATDECREWERNQIWAHCDEQDSGLDVLNTEAYLPVEYKNPDYMALAYQEFGQLELTFPTDMGKELDFYSDIQYCTLYASGSSDRDFHLGPRPLSSGTPPPSYVESTLWSVVYVEMTIGHSPFDRELHIVVDTYVDDRKFRLMIPGGLRGLDPGSASSRKSMWDELNAQKNSVDTYSCTITV